MSEADSVLLNRWLFLSLLGIVFVWVGVFMEGAEIVARRIAKRKAKRASRSEPKIPEWAHTVGDFGWIVLLVGLGLEWRGHIIITDITERENRRLSGELAIATNNSGQAIKEAARFNERASSNELAAAKANERAESLELARAEIQRQAEPRQLTPAQEWRLASELAKSPSNSVVIASPPNDEESSDFADDLDVALQKAGWKTSRIEREPIKIPRKPIWIPPEPPNWPKQYGDWRTMHLMRLSRSEVVPTKLRGVIVVHNPMASSSAADILLAALRQIEGIHLTDFRAMDFPTGEVWLVVAQKPPIGFERPFGPRVFQPTVEASNNLAKFSWTNTVVIPDPADESDAARLAAQIAATLGDVASFTTNSMPWLATNSFPFFDGVIVKVRPFISRDKSLDEETLAARRRSEVQEQEQADALVAELNKAGIGARRGAAGSDVPFGWIIVRVGRNPTREQTRSFQESEFSSTNRFHFFQK
jgi:hypothetical protein